MNTTSRRLPALTVHRLRTPLFAVSLAVLVLVVAATTGKETS